MGCAMRVEALQARSDVSCRALEEAGARSGRNTAQSHVWQAAWLAVGPVALAPQHRSAVCHHRLLLLLRLMRLRERGMEAAQPHAGALERCQLSDRRLRLDRRWQPRRGCLGLASLRGLWGAL